MSSRSPFHFQILRYAEELSNQFLIGYVFGVDKFQYRIAEKIGVFAIVKSEAHFVQIGREMLDADSMPRSHNAALEKRKSGFDGVRVNLSDHVDMAFVTNSLVPFNSSAAHRI